MLYWYSWQQEKPQNNKIPNTVRGPHTKLPARLPSFSPQKLTLGSLQATKHNTKPQGRPTLLSKSCGYSSSASSSPPLLNPVPHRSCIHPPTPSLPCCSAQTWEPSCGVGRTPEPLADTPVPSAAPWLNSAGILVRF